MRFYAKSGNKIVEKAYKMVYNKFITFINEGIYSNKLHHGRNYFG